MLLETVDGRVTQGFGPSPIREEPSMYADGNRAWWQHYAGSTFYPDFHPGIDRSAVYGSPIRAMERSRIIFAGWWDSISGYMVRAEIRPGTQYSVNHLSRIDVKLGQDVERGQLIGRVGTSGLTTGPHVHEGLSLLDPATGRAYLWNAVLFLPGGRLEDDPRIKPLAEPVRKLVVNGSGINIRWAPPSLEDMPFANTRADGIYRTKTGIRLAGLGYRFTFLNWKDADGIRWAVVSGFGGKRLAIAKSLIHFVQ